MNRKNYYDILNVNFDSTSLEIKRSYRKLANKYHPDKNNGNFSYSEYFKEINIAYETLSDPIKREKYNISFDRDETFSDYDSPNSNSTESFKDVSDKNLPLHFKIYITPEETKKGIIKRIKLSVASFCPNCCGLGLKNISICKECLGTGQKIVKKIFDLNIPPQTYPGSSLRLKNAGHESRFHKEKGDIIIDIEWYNDLWYMIDDELHTYYEISKRENNKKIFIFTNYDKNKLSISLPEDIREGQVLRIKNQGWENKYGNRSDLYIEIRFKKIGFIYRLIRLFF